MSSRKRRHSSPSLDERESNSVEDDINPADANVETEVEVEVETSPSPAQQLPLSQPLPEAVQMGEAIQDNELGSNLEVLEKWTQEESRDFYQALSLLGKRDIVGIARRVKTKSPFEISERIGLFLACLSFLFLFF